MTLLSRVAESLYWGARYLERAEDTARVVRCYTDLVIDMPTSVVSSWEPLLAVSGQARADLATEDAPGRGELEIVRFLVADVANPGSVASSIASARENLRTTREVLPRDVWQAVNDLSLYTVANAVSGVDRRNRARFLNRVVAECQRIDGAMSTLMSRDDAYELWQLGRALERADMTARVVGVRAAALLEAEATGHSEGIDIHDDVQWMGLLRSVNALQMYQRSTRGPIEASKAVAFLLLDSKFPRSVCACVASIRHALRTLPRSMETLPAVEELEALLGALNDDAGTATHDGAALDEAMDRVLLGLARINDVVAATLLRPRG
jgi:uncharacterized alpha-E superfamily protein